MDEKLSFVPHTQTQIPESSQRQSCDKQLLLGVFTSLAGSHLCCRSVVYRSISKTALTQCCTWGFAAFQVSLVQSLCGKWSLEHQGVYVGFLHAFRISSVTNHPLKPTICGTSASQIFSTRPSISAPFSHREKGEASEFDVSFLGTFKTSIGDLLPPWPLRPVLWDLPFMTIEKNQVPICAILQHFLPPEDKYLWAEFYSAPSKSSSAVSCAVHGPDFNASVTRNLNTSIFNTAVSS